MHKVLTTTLLLTLAACAVTRDIAPSTGPTPIAMVLQAGTWLTSGTDMPLLALYDDGQVISRTSAPATRTYLHTQLSDAELRTITQQLVSFGDYSQLKRVYDLTVPATDQPHTMIYLHLEGKMFTTTVDGLSLSETKRPAYSRFQHPDRLPTLLKDLYGYLIGLDFPAAQPWRPASIEVRIWPYEYAPDASMHWPEDWPGLDSPTTLKRGDSYLIFLPGAELPKLRALLRTGTARGAVEIDKKKWAVSFRFIFPGERLWWHAFRTSK
jgi:hypothetical protein